MGVAASLRGEKSISEQHFRQGLRLAKRHPRCGTVHANCELGLAGLLLGGGSADLGNPGSKPGGSGEMSGFPLPNQEEEALNLLRSVSMCIAVFPCYARWLQCSAVLSICCCKYRFMYELLINNGI